MTGSRSNADQPRQPEQPPAEVAQQPEPEEQKGAASTVTPSAAGKRKRERARSRVRAPRREEEIREEPETREPLDRGHAAEDKGLSR